MFFLFSFNFVYFQSLQINKVTREWIFCYRTDTKHFINEVLNIDKLIVFLGYSVS